MSNLARDKRISLLPIFLGIGTIAVLIGVFASINFDEPMVTNTWFSQDAFLGVSPPHQTSTSSNMSNSATNSSQMYLDTWNPQGSEAVYDSSPLQSPSPPPTLSLSPSASPNRVFTESSAPSSMVSDSADESLGFAVGGAQDINNFRENIKNDFLPLYTDITYEGLFYDYYFDTGNKQECQKLFCPSYTSAISKDPFSNKDEYYLSVGLNSGIKQSDFERKKLNLVIVLDVSGSMTSPFDQYYNDPYGVGNHNSDYSKSKMQIANEAIVGLLDHLNDDDRLGIVLFNNGAHLAKPLESMAHTDKQALEENILNIYANGGTNMESGIKMGTSLFNEVIESDQHKYENRIIFLTDAMPNIGQTSENGLFGMIENNAKQNIYSTVIGIGVDFNTELIEHVTKNRGANYYSVHSSSEFQERMVDEFEFMVTPLVFDLTLNLNADGYKIIDVYGSPESAQATGDLMKINTLFPSKTSNGQTKGGIVLIKLEKLSDDGTIHLTTNYTNRVGQIDGDVATISFDGGNPADTSRTSNDADENYYQNTGIHKGVLLTRYAELLKTWVYDERNSLAHGITPSSAYLYDEGIHVPDYVVDSLGYWDRNSSPLQVSAQYRDAISEFNDYFKQELIMIGDFELLQEVLIMEKLQDYGR